MKTSRVLTSLALLSTVGAATLRADFKDFSWRCAPGAIRSCASLQVFTTLIGGGGNGTLVTIRVRNLQGSGVDNTGGSLISRIGLTAPTIVGAGGLTVSATGGATTNGSPAGYWTLSQPGGIGGQIELTAGISPGSKQGGIVGCNAPFGGAPGNRFRTCGTGWVEFTFTTTNDWSANSAEVAWLTQFYAVNNSAEECGTDPQSGGHRSHCTAVVPEPITMVLLGSGLAGVGGAGLIRRRKGKDVTSA